MAKIFITGSTGFIGSSVLKLLLDRGHEVRALVRPGSSLGGGVGIFPQASSTRFHPPREAGAARQGHLEPVVGDLRDTAALERGIRGCEVVYHLAARYSLWNPRPRDIYEMNFIGSRNVFAAAFKAGVRKVVHTSTVGTLKPAPGKAVDEAAREDLARLRGHYKRSKWLAEEEARRWSAAGLPVVIVQPSTPVGPRDARPTPTGNMVLEFLKGRVPAYTRTGLNLVPVEDCALGHLLAADRGRVGESYILGGENLSLREIYSLLSDLSSRVAPRICLPASALLPISLLEACYCRLFNRLPKIPWEALEMARQFMYFDSGKAVRELDYSPGPVRRALAESVLWYYQNGYVEPPASHVLERLRGDVDAARLAKAEKDTSGKPVNGSSRSGRALDD
jgi:dihydroflavonol-4-reductase